MSKNLPEIKEILSEMKSNNISDFELNESGKKFSIRYRTHPVRIPPKQEQKKEPVKPAENYYTMKSRRVGCFHIFKYEEEKPEQPEQIEQEDNFISRMKGLFNHPEKRIETQTEIKAEPFVKIGEKVNLETILGSIESMKVQNEICLKNYKDFNSEYGIIREIMKKEGEPVHYGMPLFMIEPCK